MTGGCVQRIVSGLGWTRSSHAPEMTGLIVFCSSENHSLVENDGARFNPMPPPCIMKKMIHIFGNVN